METSTAPSAVSDLVTLLHTNIDSIHACLTSLNTSSTTHSTALDALTNDRETKIADLRSQHSAALEALAAQRAKDTAALEEKRQKEKEELEEKRRREYDELMRRRKVEDEEREEVARREEESRVKVAEEEDRRREVEREERERELQEKVERELEGLEDEMERKVEEGKKALRDLDEKRRQINAEIDRALNAPTVVPEIRFRSRAKTLSRERRDTVMSGNEARGDGVIDVALKPAVNNTDPKDQAAKVGEELKDDHPANGNSAERSVPPDTEPAEQEKEAEIAHSSTREEPATKAIADEEFKDEHSSLGEAVKDEDHEGGQHSTQDGKDVTHDISDIVEQDEEHALDRDVQQDTRPGEGSRDLANKDEHSQSVSSPADSAADSQNEHLPKQAGAVAGRGDNKHDDESKNEAHPHQSSEDHDLAEKDNVPSEKGFEHGEEASAQPHDEGKSPSAAMEAVGGHDPGDGDLKVDEGARDSDHNVVPTSDIHAQDGKEDVAAGHEGSRDQDQHVEPEDIAAHHVNVGDETGSGKSEKGDADHKLSNGPEETAHHPSASAEQKPNEEAHHNTASDSPDDTSATLHNLDTHATPSTDHKPFTLHEPATEDTNTETVPKSDSNLEISGADASGSTVPRSGLSDVQSDRAEDGDVREDSEGRMDRDRDRVSEGEGQGRSGYGGEVVGVNEGHKGNDKDDGGGKLGADKTHGDEHAKPKEIDVEHHEEPEHFHSASHIDNPHQEQSDASQSKEVESNDSSRAHSPQEHKLENGHEEYHSHVKTDEDLPQAKPDITTTTEDISAMSRSSPSAQPIKDTTITPQSDDDAHEHDPASEKTLTEDTNHEEEPKSASHLPLSIATGQGQQPSRMATPEPPREGLGEAVSTLAVAPQTPSSGHFAANIDNDDDNSEHDQHSDEKTEKSLSDSLKHDQEGSAEKNVSNFKNVSHSKNVDEQDFVLEPKTPVDLKPRRPSEEMMTPTASSFEDVHEGDVSYVDPDVEKHDEGPGHGDISPPAEMPQTTSAKASDAEKEDSSRDLVHDDHTENFHQISSEHDNSPDPEYTSQQPGEENPSTSATPLETPLSTGDEFFTPMVPDVGSRERDEYPLPRQLSGLDRDATPAQEPKRPSSNAEDKDHDVKDREDDEAHEHEGHEADVDDVRVEKGNLNPDRGGNQDEDRGEQPDTDEELHVQRQDDVQVEHEDDHSDTEQDSHPDEHEDGHSTHSPTQVQDGYQDHSHEESVQHVPDTNNVEDPGKPSAGSASDTHTDTANNPRDHESEHQSPLTSLATDLVSHAVVPTHIIDALDEAGVGVPLDNNKFANKAYCADDDTNTKDGTPLEADIREEDKHAHQSLDTSGNFHDHRDVSQPMTAASSQPDWASAEEDHDDGDTDDVALHTSSQDSDLDTEDIISRSDEKQSNSDNAQSNPKPTSPPLGLGAATMHHSETVDQEPATSATIVPPVDQHHEDEHQQAINNLATQPGFTPNERSETDLEYISHPERPRTPIQVPSHFSDQHAESPVTVLNSEDLFDDDSDDDDDDFPLGKYQDAAPRASNDSTEDQGSPLDDVVDDYIEEPRLDTVPEHAPVHHFTESPHRNSGLFADLVDTIRPDISLVRQMSDNFEDPGQAQTRPTSVSFDESARPFEYNPRDTSLHIRTHRADTVPSFESYARSDTPTSPSEAASSPFQENPHEEPRIQSSWVEDIPTEEPHQELKPQASPMQAEFDPFSSSANPSYISPRPSTTNLQEPEYDPFRSTSTEESAPTIPTRNIRRTPQTSPSPSPGLPALDTSSSPRPSSPKTRSRTNSLRSTPSPPSSLARRPPPPPSPRRTPPVSSPSIPSPSIFQKTRSLFESSSTSPPTQPAPAPRPLSGFFSVGRSPPPPPPPRNTSRPSSLYHVNTAEYNPDEDSEVVIKSLDGDGKPPSPAYIPSHSNSSREGSVSSLRKEEEEKVAEKRGSNPFLGGLGRLMGGNGGSGGGMGQGLEDSIHNPERLKLLGKGNGAERGS